MPAHVPAVTANRRDMAVLTTAQFCIAFALNFMFVFRPSCVHAVSPLDEAATLRWTGLISAPRRPRRKIARLSRLAGVGY